jgi:site-specific DNA recombinase
MIDRRPGYLGDKSSAALDEERAKAALDRARARCGTAAMIDAREIDAFARLMNEKLDNVDTSARKGYIRSIIDAVELDDRAIRIIRGTDIPQAAMPTNKSRAKMFVVLT